MKNIRFIFLFFLSLQLAAQEKYTTKSGSLTFESSVASFEEVKATNNKVSALLKDNGTIAALALMKGFRFKIALMEEHFNENFIESNSYPTAKFLGKINDFSINDLSQKNKKFLIEGELTVREITKKIRVTAHIKMIDNRIYIHADFKVNPTNFDIKIPAVIRKKIAKEVTVFIDFEFKKK
jgi:hypothetical protein